MSNLPTKAKVVIIGAGIHGLSTAWHLSQKYKNENDVVVLEKSNVAAGASGIACGVDTLLPSLQSLPEVVDAVKSVNGDCEIYLDGGIRRGSDILKALAFGAKAVMIGRPFYWGLAVGGENGVRDVIKILREELEVAMKYCGITDVENVDSNLLSYYFK